MMSCATEEEYHTSNGHCEAQTLQKRLSELQCSQPGQCCRAAVLLPALRAGGSAVRHQRALFLFHFSASQARLEHCPVSSLALTLTERCRQTREENSNHDCKRLRNVSCVEGWNSFFELEKKTQCKDSSTVFKCINTLVKMTVNTCPVTANDGTKSNLLKCNQGDYFRYQRKKQTRQNYYPASSWNLRRL